jgi:cytoskeletal protein RodZ
MADALYIGSLVMEMTPKAKGEPSIELTISSNAEGVITAESADLGNPGLEHQQLSLHLKSFEEDTGDYSDFDVEESGSSLYQKAEAIRDEEPERKAPWGIIILIGVVLILILLGLWFFLFRTKDPREARKSAVVSEKPLAAAPAKPAPEPAKPAAQPAKPPEPAKPAAAPAKPAAEPAQRPAAIQPAKPAPEPAKPAAQPAKPAAAAPAKPASEPAKPAAAPVKPASEPAKAPVVIDTPPKPVSSAPERQRVNAPQTIPPDGVTYRIRWGDTLWDLSEAFYRNAWLYPRIVRFNQIRNPNLIVSGTEITIPPRE